jgi:hypothetical protein
MDDVELSKNCVTTECGHCFHASCLMRSVAHNGFGCPYCRAVMAEKPEKEEDDEDEISEATFDEEEDEEYVLRGFRFFFNNLNGEEHEEEDVEEEEEVEEENQALLKPLPSYIAGKLVEQGVTVEMMVKAILTDRDEYDEEEEEFLRIEDDLWAKVHQIILDYKPEEGVAQPAVVPEPNEGLHPNVTVRRRPIMSRV